MSKLSYSLFLAVALALAPSHSDAQTDTTLTPLEVTSALDAARDDIDPSLGATIYTVNRTRLSTQSQGEDAPFNQTILRLPGVAQDSYGQLHVRGEHANLQYRINGVLLPEGISGFGQELDTRFVESLSLITGALPAQFGYRTAGIIDIQTKSGAQLAGGEFSLYGGSQETRRTSLSLGGTSGKLSYYFTGSLLQSGEGIENPMASTKALHDDTEQEKGFGYLSYTLDDTSRLSLMVSTSAADFQIPNNPGQKAAFPLAGTPRFDSAQLDENQHEKNHYGILTYQKTAGDWNWQASVFSRYSGVLYNPDAKGDLIFNGVASRVDRSIFSNGVQFDSSYQIGNNNTLRGGLAYTAEIARFKTGTAVFPTDIDGSLLSDTPRQIADNGHKTGALYGVYLQDEWHPFDPLTINFGGRFDVVDAYTHENQLSPRINLTWQATPGTTLHAGYARYFTPPPLELVQGNSLAKFAGTTNAAEIQRSSSVRSERADYFDLGISQKMTPEFQLTLDGYYKNSHSQLDEGQFGSALIFSPFNYQVGEIYGLELTATYEKDHFSAYLNLGTNRSVGRKITSGESQFGADELAYIRANPVFLDHDQRLSASAGVSYRWRETQFSADALYGSGLRDGFANTDNLPDYATVNLSVEHRFVLRDRKAIRLRVEVVNLFDESYQLRDGSGIGVGAPQYGPRRGLFGGVSYEF